MDTSLGDRACLLKEYRRKNNVAGMSSCISIRGLIGQASGFAPFSHDLEQESPSPISDRDGPYTIASRKSEQRGCHGPSLA
jgi:hypothetical protein